MMREALKVMDAINRPIRIKRLEESLEKWQNILRSRDARLDEGTEDCPCCAQWFLPHGKDVEPCIGCPIRDFTGLHGCSGTPYTEFVSAVEDSSRSFDEGEPIWNDDVERAVNAEITFLVNLITFEEYAHEYELGQGQRRR